MSKLSQIQALVRYGLYCLTEHADDEAADDEFSIYDVEYAILTGSSRRNWPKEGTVEVIGTALDGRPIGVVCRVTTGRKVCVITVSEDRP